MQLCIIMYDIVRLMWELYIITVLPRISRAVEFLSASGGKFALSVSECMVVKEDLVVVGPTTPDQCGQNTDN